MRIVVTPALASAAISAAKKYIEAKGYPDRIGRIDALNRFGAELIESLEYRAAYENPALVFNSAVDVIEFAINSAGDLNSALQSGGNWFMWDADESAIYMPKTIAPRYAAAIESGIEWRGKKPSQYREEITRRALGNFWAALRQCAKAAR